MIQEWSEHTLAKVFGSAILATFNSRLAWEKPTSEISKSLFNLIWIFKLSSSVRSSRQRLMYDKKLLYKM